MKRFLLAIIMLSSILLAACGSPAASTAPTAAPEPTVAPEPTAAPAANTRVVTDANGVELEIPAKPERVIAIIQEDFDVLIGLDFLPIAVANGMGSSEPAKYLAYATKDLPNIGDMNSPSIEKIASLKPDLILVGDMSDEWQGELLGQLREIAPVVNTMVWGEHWYEHTRRVASILGIEPKAEEVIAAYEAHVAQVRAAIGDNVNETVSIVRWNVDGPSYMQKLNFSSRVLADVGLQRPAHQQEEGFATSDRLSLEQLDLLEADWLFVGTLSPVGDHATALSDAKQSPLFQKLSPVQNDKVYEMDGSIWGTLGGPIAANLILDDVLAAMGSN